MEMTLLIKSNYSNNVDLGVNRVFSKIDGED